MTWVTCQLADGRKTTRAVNSDLVVWADDKGTTTALRMVGGEMFTILGGLPVWLTEVTSQPMTLQQELYEATSREDQ